MKAERWQKVKNILESALELEPEKRAEFLYNACLDDPELRKEVESYLEAHDSAEDFIETPAAAQMTPYFDDISEAPTVKQKFDQYKIEKKIAEGGMGIVYQAVDTRLSRKAALKVLTEGLSSDQTRLKRFLQEARASSMLNHPNIVTIYEFGEENGTYFLVTEFVEGETIREKIHKGTLSIAKSLEIAEQTAFALSAAHKAGIIHRDIKPENIMIRPDGIVKVLDFGLAKLKEKMFLPFSEDSETQEIVVTHPGVILGTVAYMSPEQARGKETDERTDIWSLGIVLFEMITRKQPFGGETSNETVTQILNNETPKLADYLSSVSAKLQNIIDKALQKEPLNRYQTATEFQNDLKELRKEIEIAENSNSTLPIPIEQTVEPQKSVEEATPNQLNTTKIIAVLFGLILLAVLLFGYFKYWS